MRRIAWVALVGCALAAMAGCKTPEGDVAWRTSPVTDAPVLGVALAAEQMVGDPLTCANLSIYPVRSSVSAEVIDYITLDEALAEDLIDITEKDQAEVARVYVTSRAELPIYLMAGEVILGGKQDRVVAKDTIVPVGAVKHAVRVFCVEPSRWDDETISFKSSGLAVSTRVRKAAQWDGDQAHVWDEVGASNDAAGVTPATGAYRVGATESRVANAAQVYVDEIASRLQGIEDAVGMVVVVDGEVVSADVYQSPELFQKLQGKLLQAHAREAAGSSASGDADASVPGTEHVAEFLKEARGGTVAERDKVVGGEMRQVTAERSVGFQTMVDAAAEAPAQIVHENYYQRGD